MKPGTVIPNGTDVVVVAVEGDIVLAVRLDNPIHPWATWVICSDGSTAGGEYCASFADALRSFYGRAGMTLEIK